VTHGFWVPALGIKVDANPGSITTLSVVPNKLGVYDIRCVELCGLNHSAMITKAYVVTDAQFLQWLKAQPAAQPVSVATVKN
jgi:cytochrome c oxidase subunit 2